ncbi:hypothetical protein BGX27_001125 [Mortierella sp. AM989]|nr:hypothetical protein BGX27_001125 [Mortierella sp. AM989]
MQYEKSRHSMEERIRTHPSLEEEGYDQYRREFQHHAHAQQPHINSQHYRVARRSSQPSHIPDHRGRHTSILNTDGQDQDYKDPDIKKMTFEDQASPIPTRRGSGGFSKTVPPSSLGVMQGSSTGSSTPSSRNGKREVTSGGVAASSQRTDNTGTRGQFHAPLEPEVVARLDDIFFKFLQRICSDLNACDSKGDHIHQPLMAKKMERLEMSTDFRPFKFRIQAFTNAFHDDLVQSGLTEDILPLRKVKVYLWKHRYISRFNEDGKKQKSKGNHVWNIEARKIWNPLTDNGNHSDGGRLDLKNIGPESIAAAGGGVGIVRQQTSPARWEFREYSSRIAGQIIKFARVGVPYVYSPRIWDAQMSCPAAKFSSPWLPSWLKWHKGELKGIPGPEDESCTIVVIAEYVREGEECRLEMSFPLTVSDPSKEGELMDSQNENEVGNEFEYEDELDEDEFEYRDHQMETDRPRQHNPRDLQANHSQSQQQAQHQAQHQLKHLHLQERPKQQQQRRGSGPRSEDDLVTSDELHEIDEEDDMEDVGEEDKLHVRKQSRERVSLLLTQEAKRRKHD